MARTIYGVVDRDGNTISGQEFTCQTYGGGIYVLELQPPFSGIPSVVSTVAGPEWETYNMSTSVIHNDGQYVVICTSDPERPKRSDFSFIAMGE